MGGMLDALPARDLRRARKSRKPQDKPRSRLDGAGGLVQVSGAVAERRALQGRDADPKLFRRRSDKTKGLLG